MGFFDIRAQMRMGFGANQPTQLQANQQSELLIAQGNPSHTEITRQGAGWNVVSTAQTEVAAFPTTVAAIEVYNNTMGPSATCLVVDSAFIFQLLGTAANQSLGLWAMVTTQKAAPTNTATSLFSHSGRPLQATVAGGRILVIFGSTIVANGWRPYGPVQAAGTATATPGSSWEAPINGRLIIPPGCSGCVTGVGSLATASAIQCGLSVYEVPLILPT